MREFSGRKNGKIVASVHEMWRWFDGDDERGEIVTFVSTHGLQR